MMIGLRPMRSDSEPKTMKNGVPSSSATAIMMLAVASRPSASAQEEQRVELAGVPDHRLAGGEAEQRQHHDLQVLPWPNDSVSGAFEVLPSFFIFWKAGDSFTSAGSTPRWRAARSRPGTGCASPRRRRLLADQVREPRITSSDRNRPSVAVVWIQLCRRRACRAAHARRRRSRRRRTRRRAPGPAAAAARSG